MAKNRIDIAVNEQGASTVIQAFHRLANEMQRLSPRMAATLRGRALRVGVNTDRLVKDVAIAALDTVVHATPHDTGQARANWQVAISTKRPAMQPQLGKLDYEGDRTVAEGTALIQSTQRRLGETIYISNALDYIQALNEGWSKQAPAGFVEKAVQKATHVASKGGVL